MSIGVGQALENLDVYLPGRRPQRQHGNAENNNAQPHCRPEQHVDSPARVAKAPQT